MLQANETNLLEHLVLNSATDEVIKSYEEKKSLEIVLTINGFDVDIMLFLKQLEDQYNQQTAHSAKKLYGKRVDEALAPFFEATDTFQQLWEHMRDEMNSLVSEATDVSWLFDKEEEPEEEPEEEGE